MAPLITLHQPITFPLNRTYNWPLGAGTDGQVDCYTHRPTGLVLAVKTPHARRAHAIWDEIDALKVLLSHGTPANITNMLAFCPNLGDSAVPAIVTACAEFGDLDAYRAAWVAQEGAAGRRPVVREESVWKLFRDMALALDFVHTTCRFVHRDVKSGNVVVARAAGDESGLLPSLPVFRLADFSRAVAQFPADGTVHYFAGTFMYAPHIAERRDKQPARAAGDVWSLGATLQEFALGVHPAMSRSAVVAYMERAGRPHPALEGDEEKWKMREWRELFSAPYRPLNVSASMLTKDFDLESRPVSQDYQPFSDELDTWYRKLFSRTRKWRVTAAVLARNLVPLADKRIASIVTEQAQRMRLKAIVLAAQPQTGKQATCERGHAPSYEGNDFAPLSPEVPYGRRLKRS